MRKGEINTNKRLSNISFIPFESSVPMYRELEKVMLKYNRNHFGFEGMQILNMLNIRSIQKVVYNWHVDSFRSPKSATSKKDIHELFVIS